MVKFSEHYNVDFFEFIELRLLLEDELGVDVDLIEKDTVKPRIRDQILEETIQIRDSKST